MFKIYNLFLTDSSSQITSQSTEQNQSSRLCFTLDVKSHQRDIYKSDQFGIRERKTSGRIARVQGIKTPEQKMVQVLPRLRVSEQMIDFWQRQSQGL